MFSRFGLGLLLLLAAWSFAPLGGCQRGGPSAVNGSTDSSRAPSSALPLPSAAVPEPTDASDATTEPPTPTELAALLQRTLNLGRLAPYWHTERPERRPLRVLRNEVVTEETPLRLFDMPVVLVTHAELEGQANPYFEFTRLKVSPTVVTIAFRYPVEGVAGEVVFRKQGTAWTEERAEVVER